VSSETLEAFRAWRRSPSHRAAYEHIEQVWRDAGALKDDRDIQAALAEAVARSERRPARRPGIANLWWVQLLAGAAAIGAVTAAVLVWPNLSGQTFVTAKGEGRLVALTDGSRVRLDTDTRLTVRLLGPERDVRLTRGQAFFEVAHDAARPFIVSADGVSVRAIGTRFDVRRDTDQNGAVAVTLVEGQVEVQADHGRQTLTLKPGERVAYAPGRELGVPTSIDLAAAISWTSGRIVFRSMPLGAAVAEINRYSARPIRLEAAKLEDAPVSGVFEAGDTAAFISGVCALYGLRATTEVNGDVVLSPSSA
jgi:transmembrane sensor